MEKGDNIWKQKYFVHGGKEEKRRRRRKIFGKGNVFWREEEERQGKRRKNIITKENNFAKWRTEIKGSIKCGPRKMETSFQMRSRI